MMNEKARDNISAGRHFQPYIRRYTQSTRTAYSLRHIPLFLLLIACYSHNGRRDISAERQDPFAASLELCLLNP